MSTERFNSEPPLRPVGGIPAWIFDPKIALPDHYLVPGAISGRQLSITVMPDSLYITDFSEFDRCRLQASISDNGFINYDLLTYGFHRDPATKHPDMYGAAFAFAARSYFEQLGHRVRGLECHWKEGSVNFAAFEPAFSQLVLSGTDAVRAVELAARETWTYQNIAEPMRFRRVVLDDIDFQAAQPFVSTFLTK